MNYSAPKNKHKTEFFLKTPFYLIAILIFAFSINAQTAFVQQAKLLGSDGAAQDSHGFSVAISGDTAVVGTPRNSGGTGLQNRGAAYVYVRSGAGVWTQQQKLTASDGAANDQFGYSVAINGNTIAVGRQNTVTGANRGDGRVYIFTRSGTVWAETQTLVSSDLAQGDLFGNSLAFENDTLVVGALNKNNGSVFFQGAAYVFTRSGAGASFAQQAKLTASDGVFADFFGYSVAVSNDSIIVGATSLAGQPNSKGKAYIFTRDGASWTQQAILQASDGTNGDAFGFAVGISNDTAVVGARLDDVGATADQGSAYVFTRSGAAWTQTQQLLGIETTQRNDTFGGSVAIRGDIIAVGAPAHEFIGSIANHGAVYVFRRTSAGSNFARTEKLVHDDPAPDALGTSVAFDGSSIISGAPSKNSARGATYIFNQISTNNQSKLTGFAGANRRFGVSAAISGDTAAVGEGSSSGLGVSIFQRNGANWNLVQQIANTFSVPTTIRYGSSIAISGDTMVIGASGSSINNANNIGAAFVYIRNGSQWVLQQQLAASDGAAFDEFGSAVAIAGDTIIVGSQRDTVGANTGQGSVFVFSRTGTVWTQQQKLTANDGASDDVFGASVALSGDTIVIGATDADINSNQGQGAAYVFTRPSASGNFTQQAKIFSNDGAGGDRFGKSSAIENGTIVVGSYQSFTPVGRAGAAFVFTGGGASWTQQQKLTASDGAVFDNYGWSVAISGDRLLVGSVGADDTRRNVPNTGAVYVYQRSGAAWNLRGKLLAYDGDNSSELGSSVAISNNYVLAGAPGDDFPGNVGDQGSAYVFNLDNAFPAGAAFDFDGDGRSDLSVFRPSENNWYVLRSTSGFTGLRFGFATDKLTPADYDGDGKTDIAVWRDGANGRFYILQSSTNTVREEDFGIAGDLPVTVGDWDGDGKADVSVYRSGAQSYFFYLGSNNNPSGNITYLPWGQTDDKPVRGDFDGDGKLDAAVFRPSNGVWYIRNSSDGSARYENWGISNDKLVPADYDGDGKTDVAVFRDGIWYIKQSSNNQPRYENFGLAGDQTAPADYDGDGKTDIAVFRSGVWYIKQSSSAAIVYGYFGTNGDRAVPSAYIQ